MGFVSTYQGSVNRWECDENDHQNVRFYLAKLHQGLAIALQKLCITDHGGAATALSAVTAHHMRFLREARVAVPQTIDCGVLSYEAGVSLRLLSLMRNSISNEVQATFVSEFDLAELAVEPPTAAPVEAPNDAQPKGVSATTSAYAKLSYQQAVDHGFTQVGAGVVSPRECSVAGTMERHHYMGRMSDGMPNLWAQYQVPGEGSERGDGFIGGAVLEYRQQFHADLVVGDSFVHVAGIHTLGNKTQSICHLVFAASSGQLVVSAEALGISMDLTTRKSIAIPPARRARIEGLKLRAPAG